MLSPHRIVSLITLFVPFILYLIFDTTSDFYLSICVLIFIYLSIEFFGAYFIGLNFHLKSLNYLDPVQNKIALTFDDGPSEPETEKVLDVLQKHDVKASFFVIGKNIKGKEAILERIDKDGHSVGSHSFSHAFWIDVWGRKKLQGDIKRSLSEIKRVTGKETNIFRPPYGVTNPVFAYVLKKLNLRSIGWNVRSYDTSAKDINKILERVLSKTKNGSIILLHDRLGLMPELLEKLIPALKARGFEFVKIE
jgi:peptidoglycan/xylan/chitin deacetylase (PgdA/CDA1 family)